MKGLFDLEFHENKIKEYQPSLSRLNEVINWELFRETIETALYVKPKGAGGRPPYDKLLMFKILVLQKYYNLSDEQTEFQINDRTSFRQFLGLEIGDKIPDEKTIWFFKEQLANNNLSEKLFELFTSQLLHKGIIAKEGSMVDASFVDVPRQRNSREENDYIKKGVLSQTECMRTIFPKSAISRYSYAAIAVRACKQFRLGSHYFANETELNCE